MKVEIIPAEGRHSPEVFEADTAEELIEKLVSSKGHATAKIIELHNALQQSQAEVTQLQSDLQQAQAAILSFHKLLRELRTSRNHLLPATRQTISMLCYEIESNYL